MTKMSELFSEWKLDQHDNFEVLPEWYTENYNIFKDRLNVLDIKSERHLIEFITLNKVQPTVIVQTDGSASLKVQIHADNDETLENRKDQISQFLSVLGIDDMVLVSESRNIFEVPIETKEQAFQFIEGLYG